MPFACPPPHWRTPPAWLRQWASYVLGWVLLAACTALLAAPAGPAALVLDDDNTRIRAWPHITVLPDADRTLTLAQALDQLDTFTPPARDTATLGVRPEAMWLRIPLTVPATSDGEWVLDIDYPVLNRVDVYLTAHGQVVQQVTLGSLQPLGQRPMRSRTLATGLDVQPGQRYDLLLRVDTRGAMVLPITLNKPGAWHGHAVNEQMLQGVLSGLGLCLLIYSIAQWINLRDVIFIQYALLISGSLLFSLHLFGIGTLYLWPNNPWFESHAAGLSSLMATCGSFLFISQTLVGNRPRSRLLWAMRGGAVLCVVIAAAFLADAISTRAIAGIISILGLVPAIMGIPGAIRRTRRGDPVGTNLLLAWLVYVVSTATVIGMIQGAIPVNFWTQHSFQFGATIDMLLFMRVLGLRTKALRLAAQTAHRERDAMRSLAHTDPLTGLPNRRGLNIALSSALPLCTADQLLAVYVMDLDGFKPVNDQYGHDVGDDLLVAVTRRLQRQIRQSDVLARLGGDEFVVMAAHLGTAQQAQNLGLKLLDAFREPFTVGDREIRVGLTVGYAIAPSDCADAHGLLKLADAAMYTGKQGGKQCLRRNTGDLALSSA